jgi:hypothetical protein
MYMRTASPLHTVFHRKHTTQPLAFDHLASIPIRGNSIGVITGENDQYFEAVGLMDTIKDELNQAAEGHSHYFLNEPLTILHDPAFPVQSEELRRILGPRCCSPLSRTTR